MLFITLVSFSVIAQVRKPAITSANRKPTTVSIINGTLKPEDYGYYFLVSRGLNPNTNTKTNYTLPNATESNPGGFIVMDVRDMKELSWWPGKGIYFPKDNQLLVETETQNYNNYLFSFSSNGKLQYALTHETPRDFAYPKLTITISEDWKTGIFSFNNDIWMADFNKLTGKFLNPSQKTSTGLFQFSQAYLIDDLVLTITHNEQYDYIINLTTKKFTKAASGDNPKPMGTYFKSIFDGGVWDMKTQKSFYNLKDKEVFLGWLDRKHLKHLVGKINSNNQPALFLNNFEVNSSKEVNWDKSIFSFSDQTLEYGDNNKNIQTASDRIISLDETQFYMISQKSSVYLYNLKTLEEKKLPITLGTFSAGKGSYVGAYNLTWTDNTHLLINGFKDSLFGEKSIDETEQGAYIYDITNNSFKKLTSYLVDNEKRILRFVRLPKSNFIVFQANNFLFRCKPDGSELQQMSQMPSLYSLESPFLSKIID